MRLTLISPRIALQKGDFLGSGVPYWPIELATLAARARDLGDDVSVLDLFGTGPTRLSDGGDHYLQGVPLDEMKSTRSVLEAEAFVVFAISYMSHQELLRIVRTLRAQRPEAPIAVLENSQAVTGYSLSQVAAPYFEAGATMLICGEPHFNWPELRASLQKKGEGTIPQNVVTASVGRAPRREIMKTGRYPVPAWELFNLEGYWSLPYAHGPKTRRFLPVLTSRGCPYPCDFCVVPETNDRRWRGNDAAAVVDEILALRDRFGVHDFQIEDLNPTVSHGRWEGICRLLIERQARIRFYIVSGTKAETVRLESVSLLASAGCRYISISPESGSSDLMRVIGKPFDYQHGVQLIRACRASGIRTQACFLVGHPAERLADFQQSQQYLRTLVNAGLDEVAVFVVAPFAGSALYKQDRIAVADVAALPSFSPHGRADYAAVERRRRALVRVFFIEKLKQGWDLWAQGLRAVFGTPETKMENLPKRMFYVSWHIARFRLASLSRG